jgi:hypothetical protein
MQKPTQFDNDWTDNHSSGELVDEDRDNPVSKSSSNGSQNHRDVPVVKTKPGTAQRHPVRNTSHG